MAFHSTPDRTDVYRDAARAAELEAHELNRELAALEARIADIRVREAQLHIVVEGASALLSQRTDSVEPRGLPELIPSDASALGHRV